MMTRIENWLLLEEVNPTVAEDARPIYLHGVVHSHPSIPDETVHTTTRVIRRTKDGLLTEGGTIYNLGACARPGRHSALMDRILNFSEPAKTNKAQ